jgi:hypothetical protein
MTLNKGFKFPVAGAREENKETSQPDQTCIQQQIKVAIIGKIYLI